MQDALMCMIIHPQHHLNNLEGHSDIWEEEFEIVTIGNDTPMQNNNGEGPALIWSEEFKSGWDQPADPTWGSADQDPEGYWADTVLFAGAAPTEW
ncbi:hypothetical protein CTheo_8737 [Ceratobasidium theobromae]|uniref:Uncharacterized protein n=1 Tax=Ceratobasidium theobromae TaxID=1582974 RepID=A0A5N5Q8S5_9AGAM|nr:hypothetical protein CTheo_8737 [Ceratobasidium theobromae]